MKGANQDKINTVYQAQEKLIEAIELLEQAVGDDGNARAYLIDQLKTLASNDHEFLCGNFNCDKLIEQLQEEEEEELAQETIDDDINNIGDEIVLMFKLKKKKQSPKK